jgi:hypothetical protein
MHSAQQAFYCGLKPVWTEVPGRGLRRYAVGAVATWPDPGREFSVDNENAETALCAPSERDLPVVAAPRQDHRGLLVAICKLDNVP